MIKIVILVTQSFFCQHNITVQLLNFFSGPTTKALTSNPPFELSGHSFFILFFELKEKFFFLSGPAVILTFTYQSWTEIHS